MPPEHADVGVDILPACLEIAGRITVIPICIQPSAEAILVYGETAFDICN